MRAIDLYRGLRDASGEGRADLDPAQALFVEHGAKLYLDQVIAKKLELQGVGADTLAASSQFLRPRL